MAAAASAAWAASAFLVKSVNVTAFSALSLISLPACAKLCTTSWVVLVCFFNGSWCLESNEDSCLDSEDFGSDVECLESDECLDSESDE